MSSSAASLTLSVSRDALAPTSLEVRLLAETEDGEPVVHGSYEQPDGEISIAGSMTFRFASGGDVVTAYAAPGTPPDSVVHSFYSTAIPLIAWAADGVEVLHASGVRTPEGVIALSGHSESGKSTLAHGLVNRGHERFAEDGVAFTVVPGGLDAVPLPFTVNLRPPAREHFDGSSLVPPVGHIHPAVAGKSPLVAIFHLRPVKDDRCATPLLERLSPSEALLCLLDNAYRFNGQPAERERRMLESYLTLTTTTPVWRLTFAQTFEQFDSLLDLVEHAARRDA